MRTLSATVVSFVLVFLWAWYGTARGTVLSGVVADVGEPVVKAEVMPVNASNDIVLGSDYTDYRGTFRFAVKPGVFNIGTFKPDHVIVWSKGVVVRDADISIRIELTPTAFVEDPSSSLEEDCDYRHDPERKKNITTVELVV